MTFLLTEYQLLSLIRSEDLKDYKIEQADKPQTWFTIGLTTQQIALLKSELPGNAKISDIYDQNFDFCVTNDDMITNAIAYSRMGALNGEQKRNYIIILTRSSLIEKGLIKNCKVINVRSC